MSKFLTNIFGNKAVAAQTMTSSAETNTKQRKEDEGRLETDALPVDYEDVSNRNGYAGQMPGSSNSTPSASVEMTAAVVRELSDPNYNSMSELVPTDRMNNGGDIATIPPTGNNTISNTMNVHNAQQQLVMQFSNVNQLHFGSVYNFNNASNTPNISANSSRKSSGIDELALATAAACNTASGESTKRQLPRKTTSIVAMMQSQEEPDHRMLETIATHLGEGWKLVMRNLGHSEGQIEQAIIDHQIHGGIKEVIYQLLLQWIRNADDGEATVARITSLLWEMQHRECVQRMKLVFKSNALRKTSR